jgi:hypothetical protein
MGGTLFAAGSKRMLLARIPELVKTLLLFSYGHNQGRILASVNRSTAKSLL